MSAYAGVRSLTLFYRPLQFYSFLLCLLVTMSAFARPSKTEHGWSTLTQVGMLV